LLLYHDWTSSSSRRVRIVCGLKAMVPENVVVSLTDNDHSQQTYLDVNAAGQVPCLELPDGTRITQSVAIVGYLDELVPDPPLMPEDPVARARVREIVELINSGTQPLHNRGLNVGFREIFQADQAAIKRWQWFWIERRYRALERLLANSPGGFSVGDALSFADVFVFAQHDKMTQLGFDVTQFSGVEELAQRLGREPAFAQTASAFL
jgi:maleylpyruvate isomerase